MKKCALWKLRKNRNFSLNGRRYYTTGRQFNGRIICKQEMIRAAFTLDPQTMVQPESEWFPPWLVATILALVILLACVYTSHCDIDFNKPIESLSNEY